MSRYFIVQMAYDGLKKKKKIKVNLLLENGLSTFFFIEI